MVLYVFTQVFSSTNSPTPPTSVQKRVRKQVSIFTSEFTSTKIGALTRARSYCAVHTPFAHRLFVASDIPGRVSLSLERELTHTSYLQTFDVQSSHSDASHFLLTELFLLKQAASKKRYILTTSSPFPTTSQTVAGQAAVRGIYCFYSSNFSVYFGNSY